MKDAYWFKHDSNAKDDPKCVLLIEQLGLEGYGIYWVLIETLRDQPEYRYPIALIPALARRYNTTAEKVKTVVQLYGLFDFDDEEFFFSSSLRERMALYDGKREKLRLAANIRWGNTDKIDANAMHMHNKSITDAKQMQCTPNAIREDKNREDNSREEKTKPPSGTKTKVFIPPTVDEVREYCIARSNGIDAERFVDHYQSVGWVVGKSKMKDWKAAVRTWEKRNSNQQRSMFENDGLKGWGL